MQKTYIIILSALGVLLILLIMQFFTPVKIFDYLKNLKLKNTETPNTQTNQEQPAPSAEKKLNIFIRQNKFVPNSNAMPLGTEITWINEQINPVTVSGDGWQSPRLQPGEKFIKIFDSAGKFSYFNASSTKMKGELVIQ